MMKLKKTVAVALATAMLASVAAVPAFAAPEIGGSRTNRKMQVMYWKDETVGEYKLYVDDATEAETNYSGKGNGVSSGTTTVRYCVTETYTWTMPVEINFGSNGGYGSTILVSPNGTETADNGERLDNTADKNTDAHYNNTDSKIIVSENVIPEGKRLVITAQGSGDDGAFVIKSGIGNGTTSLGYDIYVTADGVEHTDNDVALEAKTGEIVSLSAGTNTVTKTLTFALNTGDDSSKDAEFAGEYRGTVTFTATVTDAN